MNRPRSIAASTSGVLSDVRTAATPAAAAEVSVDTVCGGACGTTSAVAMLSHTDVGGDECNGTR